MVLAETRPDAQQNFHVNFRFCFQRSLSVSDCLSRACLPVCLSSSWQMTAGVARTNGMDRSDNESASFSVFLCSCFGCLFRSRQVGRRICASCYRPSPAPPAAAGRSVFEFSLCLSRACLGKKIIFIYEWLKKTVFLPGRPCARYPGAPETPAPFGRKIESQTPLLLVEFPGETFVPSLSWIDRVLQ